MSGDILAAKPAGWHEARRKGIGGSDAPAIMRGEFFELWRIKTGKSPPLDLSGNLAVQMGVCTEPLNAAWFARVTGRAVTHRNLAAQHKIVAFMRCELDGLTDDARTVFQAKHVAGREPFDVVLQRYMPQLVHEMLCMGLERAVLSCLIGTDRHEYRDIELDAFYAGELVAREREFWGFVERDEPPPDAPALDPPIPPEKMRKVSMQGSNQWAHAAEDWLANQTAAKLFAGAEKELKALVEKDVSEARGYGVVAKRNRAGAITLKADMAGEEVI